MNIKNNNNKTETAHGTYSTYQTAFFLDNRHGWLGVKISYLFIFFFQLDDC